MKTEAISYSPVSLNYYKKKAVQRKEEKENKKTGEKTRLTRSIVNAAIFVLGASVLYFMFKRKACSEAVAAKNRLRDILEKEDKVNLLAEQLPTKAKDPPPVFTKIPELEINTADGKFLDMLL